MTVLLIILNSYIVYLEPLWQDSSSGSGSGSRWSRAKRCPKNSSSGGARGGAGAKNELRGGAAKTWLLPAPSGSSSPTCGPIIQRSRFAKQFCKTAPAPPEEPKNGGTRAEAVFWKGRALPNRLVVAVCHIVLTILECENLFHSSCYCQLICWFWILALRRMLSVTWQIH